MFFFGKSQTSCNTAVPLYSNTTDTIVMPTSAIAPIGWNYGCLGSTNNPAFIYLPVCGSGNFQIELSNSANNDMDFIVWGPFYTTDLNVICNTISSGANSGVDCSYGVSGTEIINVNNALAGEVYMMMITNYAGTPTDAYLTQIGGTGVADTSCISNGFACGIYNLPVCEVSMNDSANHCKVIWEKIPNLSVDQYYIHRLNAQSQYVIIDSVPETDSSYYIDYSSFPASQPYRYKINYKDSCGNFNNLSNYHQSIHLQASPGFNAVNLDWDAYYGITFPTYYILRGTDPFNMNIIDSISSVFTSYTDLSPNASEPCYQVGFINPNPCVITRSLELPVVSNVFNTQPNSMDELLMNVNPKIYPNPARDFLTLELNESYLNHPTFSILDVAGREIMTQNIINSKTNIDLSNYLSGIYFLTIKEDGRLLKTVKLLKD